MMVITTAHKTESEKKESSGYSTQRSVITQGGRTFIKTVSDSPSERVEKLEELTGIAKILALPMVAVINMKKSLKR
jgi:hypothetical protein